MNQQEIISKIDKLEPEQTQLKRVNWTIPENDLELLKRYKDKKGYKSLSQTVTQIIESFFNSL